MDRVPDQLSSFRPLALSDGSGPRKHEIVFRKVVSAIRTGELAPGDRLPNEADLAEQYSISRNSVRRGLRRLQSEGLIEKRHGSGSYISPKGRSLVHSTREMALAVRYVPHSTESLIGHATGPWWSLLREGLMYGATYHGMHLVDEPWGLRTRRAPTGPSPERLAGMVIAAFGSDDPAQLMADLPGDAPTLLVNRAWSDGSTSSVTIDRELGVFEATRFLLALGHRRIGFDVLGEDNQPARDRLRGYRRAYEAAGVPVDDTMLFVGASGPSYLEWPKRLRDTLKRDRRPTALLMHHDNRVLHIIEVLESLGLRVPEDLSLIIIDDDPILSRMRPRLSAVSEPYAEMGRRAVEMIQADAGGAQKPSHVALEPQLIMRESVLPVPSRS